MVSLPTDSLWKCLAVLGLIIIFGCGYYWWPLKVQSDDDYAEMFSEQEEFAANYKIMAEATNDAIAMYNSVGGDYSKLDEVQRKFVERRLSDAEPAMKINEAKAKEMRKPMNAALVRYKRYIFATWMLGGGAIVGLLLSVVGFYRWYKQESFRATTP